jgi:hypothetical protein
MFADSMGCCYNVITKIYPLKTLTQTKSACMAGVSRSSQLSTVREVQMGRRCIQVPARKCRPESSLHWNSDITQQPRREHTPSRASGWCIIIWIYHTWPCILLATIHSHNCHRWLPCHAFHFLQDHRPRWYPPWVSTRRSALGHSLFMSFIPFLPGILQLYGYCKFLGLSLCATDLNRCWIRLLPSSSSSHLFMFLILFLPGDQKILRDTLGLKLLL